MMMSTCGSFGMKLPLLLLALSAGYAVLVLSRQQENPLDKLGRFLGAIVIIVSLGALICGAYCRIMARWGNCHTGAASVGCGMTSTPPAAETPAAPQ